MELHTQISVDLAIGCIWGKWGKLVHLLLSVLWVVGCYIVEQHHKEEQRHS